MSLAEHFSERIEKLYKFPSSRLLFITIRPTAAGKWNELSKIRSWVRRYSKIFIIVSSPVGGKHFHLIAGIEPNKTVRPQKGVHFNIQNINKKSKPLFHPSAEDVQDRLKAAYYRNEKYEELSYDLDLEAQCIISQINAMVSTYWKKKKSSSRRKCRVNEMTAAVDRVVNYLQKNLEENPSPSLYENYI